MTTTHTPGPWATDGKKLGASYTVETSDDDPSHIATVHFMSGTSIEAPTAHANALLIAAAPDLLAVVEMVAFSGAPLHEMVSAARAAIAKARGEG